MEYFLLDKIRRSLDELKKRINPSFIEVQNIGYLPDAVRYSDLKNGVFTRFEGATKWDGADKYGAFAFDIIVPPEMDREFIELFITTGREGQWDATNPQFTCYVNGKLQQGLDTNHTQVTLTEDAKAGELFHIDLIGWMGRTGTEITLSMKYAVRDETVYRLYHDLRVPYEIAGYLDKEEKTRQDIEEFLDSAVNLIDFREGSPEFHSSVAAATEYLSQEFYEGYCGKTEAVVKSVGHTHIDVAWLWTLAQTRQKSIRSFATAAELIRRYPDYIFMSSQPQLYKYVKEEEPALFEEIKRHVKEGRWEAEGGMWLEADCNLSSGESLVRQILFGKRFFKEEFGVDNRILWLPDVFGYSAALPQILKKSGIDYFMTTKISWNEVNNMPYDTFVWEGVDGTGVLTHFVTTTAFPLSPGIRATYNGNMSPSQVRGTWERYQQKRINDKVLTLFGFGDGGGGSTPLMAENVTRLAKGIPGCPKVEMTTARAYFEELEETVKNSRRLPKWCGELYLEYHRGTYTSMSKNKKYNRKSEFAYQNAETLGVLASALCGKPYPQKELSDGWETILLNQFHDIIPGSSIKEVYDESTLQYEAILKKAAEMQAEATDALVSKIKLSKDSVVLFNTTSFLRTDIAAINDAEDVTLSSGGNQLPSQKTHDGKLIALAGAVPPKGYKAFQVEQGKYAGKHCAVINNSNIETEYYSMSINSVGNITSLLDKKNSRQLLKAGGHTAIQVFEDMPRKYDNWEVSSYYTEKMWEVDEVLSQGVIENGPVRCVYRIAKKYLNSTLVQDIVLYAHTARIDFEMHIDWKEKDNFVKFALPTDLFATKASYEIQYGNVERPTHKNTSWDQARFEVCAHKWVDLSEESYGISMLNDCKYGHDIADGVMRLSLLKSTCYPNPDCDKEPQSFVFSLLPHVGGWRDADTVKEAYFLNCPMIAKAESAHDGKLPEEYSLVQTDNDGVVVEVVKQAENGEGTVLRLYECKGGRRTVGITFGISPAKAYDCDLLEQPERELCIENQKLYLAFKPYEIKTLLLK